MQLDRAADAPLPMQLAAALRDAIDAGTLRAGESVPATRLLAGRIGVARGVVVAAYEQLIAEGYLRARHGRGTEVHPELGKTATTPTIPAHSETEIAVDPVDLLTSAVSYGPLRPGVPIPSAIDSAAWRAAWRAAATRAHLVAPALGDPHLRNEIADHLRRMRATVRTARDVIVTAGTRDGLGLLLTALGTTRGRALVVGVEDPGLPSLRGVAARHGAHIVALPTDSEGLDTSRLPDGLLDVVIVTPSHQYPLGGSLPLVRRRELLAWAHSSGVIVVEDDFDSELRYTGNPLPTLAALDDEMTGSVVLLGTFSRTVAPALSAGYMLVPRAIRALVEPARHELGGPVSSVVQSALAQYLKSGELRRHTNRLLKRYAERRDLVSDRFAGVQEVLVRPMDGGLHAVLEFVGGSPDALRSREARAVGRAQEANLGAQPLGGYWHRQGDGMSGIVIGLGGTDDAEFDRALRELALLLMQDHAN
ncbi:MAG: PLP-dependent aminotransferase family protein [Leucobacter sp.]